jgi:hypothetical protein
MAGLVGLFFYDPKFCDKLSLREATADGSVICRDRSSTSYQLPAYRPAGQRIWKCIYRLNDPKRKSFRPCQQIIFPLNLLLLPLRRSTFEIRHSQFKRPRAKQAQSLRNKPKLFAV